MKTTLGLMMMIAVLPTTLVKAEDFFVLNWSGTQYYTNDAGKIVAKPYTSRDVLNRIAANTGVSASDLLLVYRPLRFDIAVILKNDPSTSFDYIQIPDPTPNDKTDMTNATGTQTVRHAFIFDEAHGTSGSGGTPIGSIFATESQRWSADGSTQISETFRGHFQFANTDPNDPSLPVGVFSGTFSTGRRIPAGG